MKFCPTNIAVIVNFIVTTIVFIYCYDVHLNNAIQKEIIKYPDDEIYVTINAFAFTIPFHGLLILLNQYFCGTVMTVILAVLIFFDCHYYISYIDIRSKNRLERSKRINDFRKKQKPTAINTAELESNSNDDTRPPDEMYLGGMSNQKRSKHRKKRSRSRKY